MRRRAVRRSCGDIFRRAYPRLVIHKCGKKWHSNGQLSVTVRKQERFVGDGRRKVPSHFRLRETATSKDISLALARTDRVTRLNSVRIDIWIFEPTETVLPHEETGVRTATYSKELSANSGRESSTKLHIDSRCVPSARVPGVWSLVTKLVNLRSCARAFPTDQNAFVYLTRQRALEN